MDHNKLLNFDQKLTKYNLTNKNDFNTYKSTIALNKKKN